MCAIMYCSRNGVFTFLILAILPYYKNLPKVHIRSSGLKRTEFHFNPFQVPNDQKQRFLVFCNNTRSMRAQGAHSSSVTSAPRMCGPYISVQMNAIRFGDKVRLQDSDSGPNRYARA